MPRHVLRVALLQPPRSRTARGRVESAIDTAADCKPAIDIAAGCKPAIDIAAGCKPAIAIDIAAGCKPAIARGVAAGCTPAIARGVAVASAIAAGCKLPRRDEQFPCATVHTELGF